MSNSAKNKMWSCKISGLSHWLGQGGWQKHDSSGANDFHLRIHHDMVFITNCDKVLESLNSKLSKMKAFVKGDRVVLVVGDQEKGMRKLKFQLTCDPATISECVRRLSTHVTVEDRNTRTVSKPYYVSVEDTLKNIVQSGSVDCSLPVPAPYEEFLKLCILDPSFPQLLSQTEAALRNLISSPK